MAIDFERARRLRRIGLIALVALVALIAFLPLRVAIGLAGLGDDALAARAATGTIWSGRLHDLSAGGIPIGNVDTALDPLALLIGRAQLSLTRSDGALAAPFNAKMASGFGFSGLSGASGSLSLGTALAPLPPARVEMTDVAIALEDGRCASAGGTLRLIPQGGIAGLTLENGLVGAPVCRDGDLVLPLVGQSGMETLDIVLQPNGRYRAILSVRGLNPESVGSLNASGFVVNGDTATLTLDGRL